MIALIAGTGHLPLEAAKALLDQKKQFLILSLFPEDNAQLLKDATSGQIEVITQEYYKPGNILSLLQSRKVSHVFFIGKVDKACLFKHLKFDWLAIKLLGSLVCKSDKDIMEALIHELAKHNIGVLRQDEILGGLLVAPGVLTGTLTKELENDIAIGLSAAKAIAHANIGQTVVVKNGVILAVEAIEGTDACIKRGIALGNGGVVVCKAARSDQNKKFDLPTLGPNSLAQFQPGDVAAIAWDSQHTLIANKEEFIQRANQLKIILISA